MNERLNLPTTARWVRAVARLIRCLRRLEGWMDGWSVAPAVNRVAGCAAVRDRRLQLECLEFVVTDICQCATREGAVRIAASPAPDCCHTPRTGTHATADGHGRCGQSLLLVSVYAESEPV